MAISVALYGSETEKRPSLAELSWKELVAKLLVHRLTDCAPCQGKHCKAKFGPAWSPVRMEPGKNRANTNVLGITAATFDLDHITQEQLEGLAQRLEGLSCVLHSTHSHHPPNDQALRIVFPLSREIRPPEWGSFWKEVAKRYEIPADKAPRALSNIFFLPSAPRGAPLVALEEDGEPLDVDAVLASAKARGVEEVEKPRTRSALTATGEVNMSGLKKLLKGYRCEGEHAEWNEELVARVLTGKPLAEAAGVERGRNSSVHQLMGILGFRLPADTPTEAVLELVRPSITSMPETPGEDAAHWMAEAEKQWEEALADREAREAEWEARRQADADLKRRLLERHRQKSNAKKTEAKTEAEEKAEEEEEEDWRKMLVVKPSGRGEDAYMKLENVGANIAIILEHSEPWKDVLRFNSLTSSLEMRGGPLGDNERAPSSLASNINNWITHYCELRVTDQMVQAQMIAVARKRTYNPVAEYLNDLKWDGKERIGEFFQRYFGVADNEYTRLVSALWPIGAVARALEPGCKMDTVLVLEGLQGAKKGQAFEALAGAWFSTNTLRLDDKDSKMLSAQNWIIELAELSSMKRSELDAQKSFLTDRIDKFRPPYGATIESFPRRCVFVGTTNENRYLVDLTGNRRFWPIRVGKLDLEALKTDRDQLWAEAVVKFKAGEQWWFTPEQQEVADWHAEARLKKPTWSMAIYEWWTELKNRPAEVTTHMVATKALHITPDRFTTKIETEIERALHFLRFKDEHRELPFSQTVWLPPEGLMNVVAISQAKNIERQTVELQNLERHRKKQLDRETIFRRIANAPIRDEIDDSNDSDDSINPDET